MKYFVEVIRETITDENATASRLSETLKLDYNKALALLRRNPVTKPINQAEAEKVARLFRRAGVEVLIRSEVPQTVAEVKAASPELPTNPKLPKAPSPLPEENPQIPAGFPDLDVKLSNPKLPMNPEPEVIFSSPDLPPVNTVPSWPNVTVSSPDLPDVKISSSTWPDVKLSSPDLPEPKRSHPDFKLSDQEPAQEESLKLPPTFFASNPQDATSEASKPFESKYPILPAVSDAPVMQPASSGSGVGHFLLASLLPGFLTIAGMGIALYLLALPFMRNQQTMAIQNTTSSLASSLSGMVDKSLDDLELRQKLQAAINRTQPALRQNHIDFVLLTDTAGNQVAGWYQDLPTPGVPDNFITPVLPEISKTLSESTVPNLPLQKQLIINSSLMNIANQVVRQQTTPVGVVTVGMRDQTLLEQIQQPTLVTLVAGLVPLLLFSLLLSLMLGRRQS